MIGSFPRPLIVSMASEAMSQKLFAVNSELEFYAPSKWWRTPRCFSSVILFVTMSSPSYTCILSELMISAGKWVARVMERRDLPAPVAPVTSTTFSFCRGREVTFIFGLTEEIFISGCVSLHITIEMVMANKEEILLLLTLKLAPLSLSQREWGRNLVKGEQMINRRNQEK